MLTHDSRSYYKLDGQKVKAFPPGFRMIAGDQYQRNFTIPQQIPPQSEWKGAQITQTALTQKAIGFNCFNYKKAAEASLSRHFMPDKKFLDANCPDGVRIELLFPSCWNGKDVDSHDHKSHVAYPKLVDGGDCPEGYPVSIVTLFYETIWNTYAFKSYDGHFALSYGDETGYGYHGDFINGWEQDVLEKAVKTCTNNSGQVQDCHVFELQDQDTQKKCNFADSKLGKEDCKQDKKGLPGNIKIAPSPAYAKGFLSSLSTALPSASIPTSLLNPLKSAGSFFSQSDSSAGSASSTPTSSSAVSSATLFSSSKTQAATTSKPSKAAPAPITTSYSTDGNTVHEVVVMQETTTTTLGEQSVQTQVAKRGDIPVDEVPKHLNLGEVEEHVKRHGSGHHGHGHGH